VANTLPLIGLVAERRVGNTSPCRKTFSLISPDTIDRSARPARDAKSCLRSWRQSADTVTSARGSKVIGGRIYDATICLNRALICQNIAIRTENDACVSDRDQNRK
jgi:hypothetical protein